MNTEILEKPLSKAEQKRRDQAQAVEYLKTILKPGDTVFTILRRRSSSGMTRHISLVVMESGKSVDITWAAARAKGDKMDRDTGGIVVGGCGMDMGFHLVYGLSHAIFRDAFFCSGKNCPANDHSNAFTTWAMGRCLVCDKQMTEEKKDHTNFQAEVDAAKYTRFSRGTKFPVCSSKCARGPWKHSDSGYALGHKWL